MPTREQVFEKALRIIATASYEEFAREVARKALFTRKAKKMEKVKVGKSCFFNEFADTVKNVSCEKWACSDFSDDVSDKIFQLMEKEKVTEEELAKRTGYSKSYISQVLAGDCNITFKVLTKILFHLNAKPCINILRNIK